MRWRAQIFHAIGFDSSARGFGPKGARFLFCIVFSTVVRLSLVSLLRSTIRGTKRSARKKQMFYPPTKKPVRKSKPVPCMIIKDFESYFAVHRLGKNFAGS